MLDNLSGSPIQIPKQLSASSVYWIGQNATLTASDATFGQVQLTPKVMGMRCQFSNLLNILSNPAIENLIRNDMARVAALELDRVALRGSGASNQPLGIVNTGGIGSLAIGTNGGIYDWDFAAQALAALDTADALGERVGFVAHPNVAWKMKRQRIPQFSGDSGGAYVSLPIISDAQLSAMLGYGMYTTTQLPTTLTKGSSSDCSEVYCADWSQLLVGLWGNLELLATNVGGNAWAANAIEVRMIQNVDIQIRHAESFVVTSDARTN